MPVVSCCCSLAVCRICTGLVAVLSSALAVVSGCQEVDPAKMVISVHEEVPGLPRCESSDAGSVSGWQRTFTFGLAASPLLSWTCQLVARMYGELAHTLHCFVSGFAATCLFHFVCRIVSIRVGCSCQRCVLAGSNWQHHRSAAVPLSASKPPSPLVDSGSAARVQLTCTSMQSDSIDISRILRCRRYAPAVFSGFIVSRWRSGRGCSPHTERLGR